MGCRLTRTESTENCEKQTESSPKEKVNEKKGKESSLSSAPLLKNGTAPPSLAVPNKPIGEVESASQADFFRMLDDKIENGADLESEMDD